MMTWKRPQILRTSPALIVVCLLAFSAQAKYSGGSGTLTDPYQIRTAADLIAIGETPEDHDKHFILTADIDLASEARATAAVPEFQGRFDGRGHAIRNLKITGAGNLGLFGKLADEARVKGLRLLNVTITGSGDNVAGLAGESNEYCVISNCCSSGSVKGRNHVGGLVGDSASSVLDCNSTGTVNGQENVGGLLGSNDRIVLRCYSDSSVKGLRYVGGLAGSNLGVLGNCYSSGSVDGQETTGGLVGFNDGVVGGCYSRGKVTAAHDAGGLIGDKGQDGYAEHCFWDRETSRQDTSAGGTGKTTAQMKDMKTYCDLNSPNPDPNACWDFMDETKYGTSEIWQMPTGGGYPVLSIFADYRPQLQGKGTAPDPYLVGTAAELGAMCYDPLSSYKLTADVNLAGITWAAPVVAEYWGTLDGNGYSIRSLKISRGCGVYVGLFGALMPLAVVKDVNLVNVDLHGLEQMSFPSLGGPGGLGGLAGWNWGQIVRCRVSGVIRGAFDTGGLVGLNVGTLFNCSSTANVSGKVNGYGAVGGLVGYNLCNVVACQSSGQITGEYTGTNDRQLAVGGLVGYNERGSVVHCCTTATVMSSGSGRPHAGGLVGSNFMGNIVNCHSGGEVGGTGCLGGIAGSNVLASISNCYSITMPLAGDPVGGLVGRSQWIGEMAQMLAPMLAMLGFDERACISNSIWDKERTGILWSDGGTGMTTAAMTDIKTYLAIGWDFVDERANGTSEVWRMPSL
ncbi:MAG: hypothetical protein EHM35_08030, partial [Planctomycetaceae bacterium]